jgi:hypothetical protein
LIENGEEKKKKKVYGEKKINLEEEKGKFSWIEEIIDRKWDNKVRKKKG